MTATATCRSTSSVGRSYCARSFGDQTDTSVNIDPSKGALPEVERIVQRIREKWPEAEIILRADSGFARERVIKWCEDNGVDYVFGLAKNSRLKDRIEDLMVRVEEKALGLGEPVRRFKNLCYSTLDSWSKKRRVVAKAGGRTGHELRRDPSPGGPVLWEAREKRPAKSKYLQGGSCRRGFPSHSTRGGSSRLSAPRLKRSLKRPLKRVIIWEGLE